VIGASARRSVLLHALQHWQSRHYNLARHVGMIVGHTKTSLDQVAAGDVLGRHLLRVIRIDDATEAHPTWYRLRKVAYARSSSLAHTQNLIGQLAQLHDAAEPLRIGRAGRFDDEGGEARQRDVNVCRVH
jgi:hypothetical protein